MSKTKGGARPGAGRKALTETPVTITTSIEPSVRDKAKKYFGSIPNAIRFAVDIKDKLI